MPDLYQQVRTHLKGQGRVVLSTKPLALDDRLADRLRGQKGELVLVSADLHDPMPAWLETRLGKKFGAQCTWLSLASLAEQSPEIAKSCAELRVVLTTEMVLASPLLSLALPPLLAGLGKSKQNTGNWVFRTKGTLEGVLEGVNTGVSECFRLKVSPEGLNRWPALDPGNLPFEAQFSKHARILMIPAGEVSAFVSLATSKERREGF
ncbi:MAG: hypothetical protein ACI9VR_003175 [Cognaticolwellia sp.]|jgi:hypothetical protein